MHNTDNEKLTLNEVIAMGMVGGGIFSVLGLAIAQQPDFDCLPADSMYSA